MARKYLALIACAAGALGACTGNPDIQSSDGGGTPTKPVGSDMAALPDAAMVPFAAEPPAVYVAKVKNILVGLPPTDQEVKMVEADPTQLATLIDQWMVLPQYQAKMMVFFELAFQQTQITSADFVDLIPKNGIGIGAAVPLLVQNIRESFARTALELVQEGQPLNSAMTTKRIMMTPPLMELYAFLDSWHVDDAGNITDAFYSKNKTLQIVLESSAGPIPIADTLNPQSPNYMHWYDPDLPKLVYPDPTCTADPISMVASSYALHYLMYGAVYDHKGPNGNCPPRAGTAAGVQFTTDDFSAWKMVTIRPPAVNETTTNFYDLPTLRSASELVINTPHPGFFSTPAFFANWQTNTSNQARVTLNQALIVATGKQVDGTDLTTPATTPGLDAVHAAPGSACFSCHQTLDPTRSIISSTYSWFYYTQTDPALIAQKGLFAFQGVITQVNDIDDFASTLADHPALPAAWAEKLCYYANSSPCATDDPAFQKIVSDFKTGNYSWNLLVRELLSSPIITNASETKTFDENGEIIGVSRRDHLCAALNNRLGLIDVCGLDVVSKKVLSSVVPEIAAGLPSDGYGRGATAPVLPNQPTLFYRAGVENICEAIAPLVIDAAANPNLPNVVKWSSAQPAAAISDFVSNVMALTPSDPRSVQANALLTTHFQSAMKSGATASDSLKSTFIVACLSPSAVGIGL